MLPEQAVDKRGCRQETIVGGGDSYLHCGGQWYATVKAPESVTYVEIAPPPGIRVADLSDRAVALGGSSKIRYYLDGDTFYRMANANEGGGYLIVEPPAGLRLQRLPSGAERSIPIVSEGVTYYAYDGRFYRRSTDESGRAVYELTVSPF